MLPWIQTERGHERSRPPSNASWVIGSESVLECVQTWQQFRPLMIGFPLTYLNICKIWKGSECRKKSPGKGPSAVTVHNTTYLAHLGGIRAAACNTNWETKSQALTSKWLLPSETEEWLIVQWQWGRPAPPAMTADFLVTSDQGRYKKM